MITFVFLQINAYLESVAAEHSDIVTLVTAGKSWNDRDIKYLKVQLEPAIYFMIMIIPA